MKKRYMAFLLAVLMLLTLLPVTAFGVGNYGVNLGSAAYQTNLNPFFASGYGGRISDGYDGECTWYAWGRAYEKLGVSLPCRGNATGWTTEAANAGYSTGTTARENSIMVEHYSPFGHVFFVEKVENGYAYVTEGNYDGYYHEDKIDLSTMKRTGWSKSMNAVDYIYLSTSHTHSFPSAWTYDSTNHWHKCTGCTEISGKAVHSFNGGVVTSEPTYYDVGIKTHTCTVCGYSYTTEIPRLNPSGYCGGEGDGTNLTWTLDWNTGVLTISGTGKMADYDGWVNPAPWYGLNFSAVSIGNRVTTIGDRAFEWCESLVSVTIPDSVTTIGDYAFEGCNNLTNVTIPDTVTRIGDWAFDQTPWLESLGDFAIVNGILLRYQGEDTSVTVPKTATKIAGAFCYCENITDITIPASVTEFSSWFIFGKCLSLQKLTFLGDAPSVRVTNNIFEEYLIDDLIIHAPKNNSTWTSCDLYDADAQTWSGCSIVFDIDEEMQGNIVASGYCGGEGDGTNLTWTLDSTGTLTIEGTGKMADYNFEMVSPWNHEAVTTVDIQSDVTSIGSEAFYHCTNITEVKIPDSVIDIGRHGFANCSSLQSITIPQNVSSIGNYAFFDCAGLLSVHVDGQNSKYCDINGVLFDKTKETLLQYPGGCKGSYTIPAGTKTISDSAFENCSGLMGVTMPDSVESIGHSAFRNCRNMISVTLSNGLQSVLSGAFYNCSGLTNITIPKSITEISDTMFALCTGLTNITIPENVVSIGSSAFYGCPNLAAVIIQNHNAVIGDYAFSDYEVFPRTTDIAIYCYKNSTAEQYAKNNGITVKHITTTVSVEEDRAHGITAEIAETLSNNAAVNSFTDTGLDSALVGTAYVGKTATIKASVESVTKTGDTTTLTFDIAPYVDGEDVSGAVNGSEVTVRVPLTAEFTNYAKVEHDGDDDAYYEVKTGSDGAPYIDIVTTHFSSFTVSNVDKLPDDGGDDPDDPTPPDDPKPSGGCYVATCVYGSYDCPEVWTLRRFRDETLAKTWYGRAFIHTYYAISPTIVKWFGDTNWFKNMWRGTLDKMVENLNAKGVPNTAYDDIDW